MAIAHCHTKEIWIKKGTDDNYDVSMSSSEGVEMCVLVGCLPLYHINIIIDPGHHGFYWDNGLNILDNSTLKKEDMIRKKQTKKPTQFFFIYFGFRLEISTNLKIINFLII